MSDFVRQWQLALLTRGPCRRVRTDLRAGAEGGLVRVFPARVWFALAVLLALSLAACAKPDPIIRYVTTEVPVPVSVPCDPDIGPEPAYVVTPEAVAAAPD
jgi:hypothetical protein